jgi:hypothetical protein
MNGINLEKHFSLTSSKFVQEICNPLLAPIGITYFNYIKIYNKDCSRELLTNNPDWIDHFYKNALYASIFIHRRQYIASTIECPSNICITPPQPTFYRSTPNNITLTYYICCGSHIFWTPPSLMISFHDNIHSTLSTICHTIPGSPIR